MNIYFFQDNTKAVEEILATEYPKYPGYDLVTRFNDIDQAHQHDSSLSSDDDQDNVELSGDNADENDSDDDDDEDIFDDHYSPPATENVVINLPLSG